MKNTSGVRAFAEGESQSCAALREKEQEPNELRSEAPPTSEQPAEETSNALRGYWKERIARYAHDALMASSKGDYGKAFHKMSMAEATELCLTDLNDHT